MRDIRNMANPDERTTVVKTADLLEKLRENRASHLQEYEEAVEGYLGEARARLKKEFEKAQNKLQDAFDRTQEELQRFDPEKAEDTIVFCKSIAFQLTAPRNFVDAYDQAIEMMKWEQREQVELNTTEFRCFVMNKWDWMETFKMSTSSYLNN